MIGCLVWVKYLKLIKGHVVIWRTENKKTEKDSRKRIWKVALANIIYSKKAYRKFSIKINTPYLSKIFAKFWALKYSEKMSIKLVFRSSTIIIWSHVKSKNVSKL